MKILYGVQGTGNGHITRAIEIIPHLQKWGQVDILVSGTSSDIELPFEVKYKYNGLSFVFGKQGGVDVWRTYWKLKSFKLMKEIKTLPIHKYDLIISDFEPVSSWAALKAGKPCIGLSNQIATLHPMAPMPAKTDLLGKLVLSHYAPVTIGYGYHFKALDQHVFTPIIRKEVRELTPTSEGHYTVYLPAYSDKKIIKHLQKFEAIKWEIFSKHSKKKYKEKNCKIQPIHSDKFLSSLGSCEGVICNAGFGTTSEALFLKKKLLVIPMKNQFEQHCNAAMLSQMGVSSIKKLNKKNRDAIGNWILSTEIVEVDYPDNTAEIIETIVKNHANQSTLPSKKDKSYSKLFKNL
ncbi:MAG: glycosyl transferase [Bacteroidetes bacterium B1(2017)]|nr:MAG: glycosyl transferase [Bacteroidetes bacterium B1(2017)]